MVSTMTHKSIRNGAPERSKKEAGTKIVIKSADLNHNNYLLHVSHVFNNGKARNLMTLGTNNRQKSMPGA